MQPALEAAGTMLGIPQVTIWGVRVVADDGFTGPGYGQPTPDCAATIRLAAGAERLLLDPVYIGKSMAGLLASARRTVWPVRAERGIPPYWRGRGAQRRSGHP